MSSHGRIGTLRMLLVLALPMILARATQSVMTFADALMVEHLGPASIAASATGGFNTFLIMILPMGTAFIVQSFVSQLVGAGDRNSTTRFAWYGLIIAGVAGGIALALIPLVDPLLELADFSDEVRAAMSSYIAIRMFSVAAVVAVEALGNWYGGLGNTWMALIASVISMCSDLFLNWVLIYGNLGAPEMGVDGAALSSTIGSFVGLAFLAVAFWRRWGMAIGGPAPARGHGRLSLRELGRVIRFGLPNGLNWFLEFAAFQIFINSVLATLGDDALAALNVVIAINSVSFMPAFGVASAGAILAGQAIGRGDPHQVRGVMFLTMRTAAVWQVTIGAIYLLAPGPIIELFDSGGPEVETASLLVVGTVMLRLSAAWQIFDATAMTVSEILRSAGDTTWPMLARLGLAWVVFVPASLVAVKVLGGGEVAVMLCLVAYLAALAGLLAYRFGSGAWRRIDLTGHAEPTVD